MLFQHEVQLIDAQIIALEGRREVLVQRSEQGSKILSELADLLDSLQPVQPEAIDLIENEILEMLKVAKDSIVPGVELEPEVIEPEVIEPEVIEPEVTESEVTEPEVIEPEVTESEVTESEVTESEVTESEVTEPEVTEPEVTESAVEIETTINSSIFAQGNKLLICGKSKNRLNRWRDWLSSKVECNEFTTVKKSGFHHITGCKWHFECVCSAEVQRFLLAEYEQDKMPLKNVEFASAA
jgi:hypothetical protein